MDSKEIMIGDWLLWDNTLPCIVTTIGCDYIETTKCGITLAESHLLQGVPLTFEILWKNFPDIEDGVIWSETSDDNLFNIRVEYDKYIEGIFNYVHELQHALKLCGINKEIKV